MRRSRRARYALAVVLATAAAIACAGCPRPDRDVVPETRDVRGQASDDAGAAPRAEPYTYVARRRHATVGLVGARFVATAEARRLVDHIADELEMCARRLEARGQLAHGAAQLVAAHGPHGNAEVTDIRLSPGGPVAANALECIVAPLRATTLPAAKGDGVPAIAIEATWAPESAERMDAGDAEGGPLW